MNGFVALLIACANNLNEEVWFTNYLEGEKEAETIRRLIVHAGEESGIWFEVTLGRINGHFPYAQAIVAPSEELEMT